MHVLRFVFSSRKEHTLYVQLEVGGATRFYLLTDLFVLCLSLKGCKMHYVWKTKNIRILNFGKILVLPRILASVIDCTRVRHASLVKSLELLYNDDNCFRR